MEINIDWELGNLCVGHCSLLLYDNSFILHNNPVM